MVRLRIEAGTSGDTISVTGAAFHHLAHVLRARVGEKLEIFDGRGHAHEALIVGMTGTEAALKVGPAIPRPIGAAIALIPCLTRAEKFEWMLQKGTELGASCFAPAFSARSAIRLAAGKIPDRLKRWRRIVQEAARQSGRADVPLVLEPRELADAVQEAAASLGARPVTLILDEEERDRRLGQAVQASPSGAPIALVVGPEGGFDRGEISKLVGSGAIPVTLGPKITRAETSPLAALAILLHLQGELG
jgi:16S rRNA (uracil1498-N3)-methyltransferase